MRIFAPNEIVAKSRFWYFLAKLKKVKKANGEVVSLNVVRRHILITRPGRIPGSDHRSRVEFALKTPLLTHHLPADPRKAPHEGQELWRLDPIRLPLRNAQHVQRVPRNVESGGGRRTLPGHGREAQSSFPDDPRMIAKKSPRKLDED